MLQAELERKPERLRMRGRQRPAGISLNSLGHLFGEKRLCTVSFLWKDALCEDELRRKIRAVLSVYGNRILRAKGIVAASDAAGGLLFQYSGEALRIERIGAAGEMLCFIGLDLNGEVLETSFRKG